MTIATSHLDNTLNQLAELLCHHFPDDYNAEIYQRIAEDKNDPASQIGKLAQGIAMSDFVAEVFKKQPHLI